MALLTVQMNNQYRNDGVLSDQNNTNDDNRTVLDIIFSTGQRGKRYDWWTDQEYYEELEISQTAIRTERLDKGLSVIDNHRSYEGVDGVFGVTDTYTIADGKITGDVRFASDPESDIKYNKVKDRVLRHVSLGYKTHRMMYVGDAEDGLPIYRAVDWEPTELSFTPVSFETNNGVQRSKDDGQPNNVYRCEIETGDNDMARLPFKLMTRGGYQAPADEGNLPPSVAVPAVTEPATTRTEPVAPAVTEPATARTEPAAPVETPVTRAAITEELNKFRTIGRKCGMDDEEITRNFDSNITLAQFRELALDKLADDSESKIHGRTRGSQQDQGEQEREAACIYLMSRGGQGINVPAMTDLARQYRGMNLLDMVRHFTGAGFNEHKNKTAGRAFQSTSDFALIMENVMHKTLQAGYAETPRTFLGLPMIKNASDFREQHVYRLGDAPSLMPLNEDGEYETGTFGSEKESFAIDTYARKIAVTRKALINDDMSALSILPYMFGQAGSRLESDLFWGMVLNWNFQTQKAAAFKMRDGSHLFDKAKHGNVIDGADSAISKTALSDMRKLGRKQKTVDGNLMNIEFNTFVFGEDQETTAEDLLVNTLYPNIPENINTFRGKSEMRIEPRLNQVSDTAWYGFSNLIKAFVISYLDGEEGMYSETINSTDSDGMTVLARKEFGVGMVDWRGAAKSKGAV